MFAPIEYGQGDRVTNAGVNEIIRNLGQSGLDIGGESMDGARLPGGTSHSYAGSDRFPASFIGVITSNGGSVGIADYTDARYWIKPVSINSATGEAGAISLESDPPPQDDAGAYSSPWPATATNLEELDSNSHSLPTDESVYVRVWLAPDKGDGADCNHWVFEKQPLDSFIARVTASSQDGSNKRWSYSVTEVSQTAAGYGHWSDRTGGRSVTAYNLIEDQNGATGTFGNGIASTNLTGTFDIQAVPTGTRIEVTPRTMTTGAIAYWFSYENGIDGAC